jgi:hypothetical protein
MFRNIKQRTLLKDISSNRVEGNGSNLATFSPVCIMGGSAGMFIKAIVNMMVKKIFSNTPWMIRDLNDSSWTRGRWIQGGGRVSGSSSSFPFCCSSNALGLKRSIRINSGDGAE